MDTPIGEVARQTGVTERTLRFYEELGLLTPRRDSGGRRRYDAEHVDRLYRIRVLRALGTPVGELDPDSADLLTITTGHLADLDRRIGELSRQRERVRTIEGRLISGQQPTGEARPYSADSRCIQINPSPAYTSPCTTVPDSSRTSSPPANPNTSTR